MTDSGKGWRVALQDELPPGTSGARAMTSDWARCSAT